MKRIQNSALSATFAVATLVAPAMYMFNSPTAQAGTVSASFTDLALGTTTDLTAVATEDWVKYGNNEGGTSYSTVRMSGVTPIISSTLTPLGTPPQGATVVLSAFTGGGVLGFDWSDGDLPVSGSSDTVVTEAITPGQPDYPLGLGTYLTAAADASTRVIDVWVQGFDADMLMLASMSGGGSDQITISPTKNPASDPDHNYSSGLFRVAYSGVGETLSVTVVTVPPADPGTTGYANAGIFAAAIVPEPSSIALMGFAGLAVAMVAVRRRRS